MRCVCPYPEMRGLVWTRDVDCPVHGDEAGGFSSNPDAERVMGRRLEEGERVVPFDQPAELGYVCPLCKVQVRPDGDLDERLAWSEYDGFLWCAACNIDIPSALCVVLDGAPLHDRPWWHHGIEDAVGVFLRTVERAAALGVEGAEK